MLDCFHNTPNKIIIGTLSFSNFEKPNTEFCYEGPVNQ